MSTVRRSFACNFKSTATGGGGGGGGAPTDIANLEAWYSAEAVTGLSDNTSVATWNDISGNARHATGVAIGANKPLYRTTLGPSGGAAIQFDGSGYFTLPSAVFSGATAGEGFLKVKSNGSDCGLWSIGSYAGFGDENHYPFSGTVYEGFGLAPGQRRSFNPSLAITSWRCYNVWSSPSDHGAELDGVTQLASASLTVGFASSPGLGVGGKSGGFDMRFLGYMSAAIFYSRKLTTTERASVVTYLTAHPSGGP